MMLSDIDFVLLPLSVTGGGNRGNFWGNRFFVSTTPYKNIFIILVTPVTPKIIHLTKRKLNFVSYKKRMFFGVTGVTILYNISTVIVFLVTPTVTPVTPIGEKCAAVVVFCGVTDLDSFKVIPPVRCLAP